MSFTHPALLLALFVPVLVLAWVWRREQGRVVLPFDHQGSGQGHLWRRTLHIAESLPALLLALVIMILAGPQESVEPKTKRVLTNIEFCVDISGSMTAEFDSGSRYDGAMAALIGFLDRRPNDAFGLTFFGSSVLHWVPLSSDTSAIRCAPPFMRPENVPPWFGGTEIGKALHACAQVLDAREEGDRMIVLVSDGESSDLDDGRDEQLARALKERNIVVNAIHISDDEIPAAIVNITALTGGDVYNPGDEEALKVVFKRIDEMQVTRLETVAAESIDRFFPFCVAALSILGVALLALFGLRFSPW